MSATTSLNSSVRSGVTGRTATASLPRALFVSNESSLGPIPGGTSICTQEYLSALREVGFELETVPFGFDRSLKSRISRRLFNRAYSCLVPPSTIHEIKTRVGSTGASWVFLNFRDSIAIAPQLRELLPETRIVHLSHGPDSIDYLHELRSRSTERPFHQIKKSEELLLARQLIEECRHRMALDDVVCLSPVETEIERWLGAKRVTWIPRIVKRDPIPWQPKPMTVGFVGALDHPPNVEGLLMVLKELQRRKTQLHVRLVGGPEENGKQLQSDFPFVKYCGRLPDPELRQEASTWTCFMHPVYCYARGASTKLATGLSWGLPIVTTTPGTRGYQWNDGKLLLGETPHEFADLLEQLTTDESRCQAARDQVARVVGSSPTLADVADRLASFFEVDFRSSKA